MRQRMRDHLVTPPAAGQPEDGSEILGKFDLKRDTGAIVDIEFMVQYVALQGHQGMAALFAGQTLCGSWMNLSRRA